MADWAKMTIGASLTTFIWMLATFITPPDDENTLQKFVDKVNPGGPGWKNFNSKIGSERWPVPKGICSTVLGCIAVYGILLSIGQLIYGHTLIFTFLLCISFLAILGIYKIWK